MERKPSPFWTVFAVLLILGAGLVVGYLVFAPPSKPAMTHAEYEDGLRKIYQAADPNYTKLDALKDAIDANTAALKARR